MKGVALLLVSLFPLPLFAQQVQTVLPKSKVTTGIAFQLQYVVTGASFVSVDPAVSFPNFQLVSGPNIYKGITTVNGQEQTVNNIVYTLVPLSAGNYKINGITVKADEKIIEAAHVSLAVAAPPKVSFNVSSSYTDVSLYAPSSRSNVDAIIKENLFVKAEVDKTSCYEGEAIVATFKLYSRLQSTSEVVKTPGFYGFTAVDMVDINKPNQSVETIDGKIFNTSILRKVQLFPTRSGKQMIDAMRVNHFIEFADSLNDSRKIELQKETGTPAIQINIKPLPAKAPADFDGAVGNFSIKAIMEREKISLNEQGRLLITIAGRGNFIQFTGPEIGWPKGFDVYQSGIKENIYKSKAPLEGYKTYNYHFSASKAGKVVIPPIHFSFFNPEKKKFETVSTDSLQFEITAAAATTSVGSGQKQASSVPWIWISVIVFLLTLIAILLFKNKKKPVEVAVQPLRRNYLAELDALQNSLHRDKETAHTIQQIISDFLSDQFGTSRLQIIEAKMGAEQFVQLQTLFTHCGEAAYANSNHQGRKEVLIKEAIKILKAIG